MIGRHFGRQISTILNNESTNILTMWISKKVYWNEDDQRIRWTQNSTYAASIQFVYAGNMTEPEFDLLLEVLFELYDDEKISLEDFLIIFNEIRTFCDRIKKYIEE